MNGELVDLAAVRASTREPDVRMVVQLWKLEDGTIRYDAYVEEYLADGEPGRGEGWIRANLRWAILRYAAAWRMGLRRRRRGER